jgi:PAS domain S-box-containing protein
MNHSRSIPLPSFSCRIALLVLALLLFLFPVPGAPAKDSAGAVELTTAERAWLLAHPVIRLAPDPEFRPIEFFDEHGVYQGAAADHVRLLEEKLGIRFVIVRLKNWDEVMDRFKRHDVDVLGAVAATPARQEFMHFSQPLVEVPGGIFTRTGASERPLTIADLKGKRVAVVSNYMAHDYLRTQHPDLTLKVVPDVVTGLTMASLGTVDVYVENMANASYYLQQAGISNLRLAGYTDFSYRWGIGIRKDWPELQGIIDKGIAAISAQEKKELIGRWIHFEGQPWRPDRDFVIKAAAVAGIALLLGIVLWNRSLQDRVRLQTASLEQQLEERRQGELALRTEKETAQRYFDTAAVMLLVVGTDMRVQRINRKGCQLLGYDEHEIIGRNWSDTFIPPDLRPEIALMAEKVLRGEMLPPSTYENPVVTKSGEHRLISWQNALLHDEQGRLCAFLSSGEDITDRRRAELALASMNAELEASNRELESFCYSVSHDLRAPLRAINGAATLLADDMGPLLDDKGRKLLQTMARNSHRMGELIDDLLAFSRLGRQEVGKETVAMEQLAREVSEGLLAESGGRDISCTIAPLPPAQGNPAMIRQVLFNLLANAIKFTGTTAHAVIEIGSRQETAETVYFVRDNGVGFDMQYAEKMFEVFSRLDAEHAFEGTGIGLAIVKRIVHKHGGRVWAEGSPGQGATVFFALPT